LINSLKLKPLSVWFYATDVGYFATISYIFILLTNGGYVSG